MSKKTVVCAVASVLAVAVSFTTSAWARLPGDFTDDTALNASSPSIVDVFDFMIWNHFKFTTNPNGHLVGDENGDGNIDGVDFLSWNANKFTNDGAGTCNAATTACITNAQYLTALTSAPRNIPDLSSNSSLAPVFSVDNTNSILSVTLQPGTLLQAFSVMSPSAAIGFGTNFADGEFFINGSGAPTTVTSAYSNGRQQWLTVPPLGSSDGGWDDTIVNPNSMVATFPPGSLNDSEIFWNLQADSLLGIGTQVLVDCDFDGDDNCTLTDIDMLTAATADALLNPPGDLNFDLTSDGVVNEEDITQWLIDAGARPENVAVTGGDPFFRGDAQLDGVVDGLDYFLWNFNKFCPGPDCNPNAVPPFDQWSKGNFNGDGIIDGLDYLIWNKNKFCPGPDCDNTPPNAPGGVGAVPEPSCGLLAILCGMMIPAARRSRS